MENSYSVPRKPLTDVEVKQIISLKKIDLKPWQISKITGVSYGKVKRICDSKPARTRRTSKSIFDWKDFNNSII